MTIQDFVNKGISVINNMGELRTVRNEPKYTSIPFPNGWVASVIHEDEGYSVATCDYNGYFNWNILNDFGANDDGKFNCKTEDEVCKALAIIENL